MSIESQIREVAADRLTVDPRVQRNPDPARVRRMADTWDDLMVGVLVVSHRSGFVILDGQPVGQQQESFVVLDGQTRLEAFRLVCSDDRSTSGLLTAQVYEGLSLQEEASIFLRHNDRRAVTPLDRYRIAVTAKEEWALDIRDISERHGWYIIGAEVLHGGRRFGAVGSAEKIYRLDDGISLGRVFDVIDAAWQNPSGAVCLETLHGLGTLFYRHGDRIDSRSLVRRLAKTGFNKFLSGVADRRRAVPGTSLAKASADWTLDLYNAGRRSKLV